jgi:hypothetical protein
MGKYEFSSQQNNQALDTNKAEVIINVTIPEFINYFFTKKYSTYKICKILQYILKQYLLTRFK